MPRVFIAVETPRALRERVAWVREKLGGTGAPVRWVDPAQAHLTLRFLGEVPDEQLEAVRQAMAGAAAGVAPFSVTYQGVGSFGPRGRPRVIWLGVGGGVEALAALAARLENALRAAGFPPSDKLFSPHVTVGRVHDPAPTAALFRLTRDLELLKVGSLGGATVESLDLMASDLSRAGPVYRRLHRVSLTADSLEAER